MRDINNVVHLFPVDKDRSTVQIELDAIDYQLQTIAESIDKIKKHNNIQNDWELTSINRAINNIAQRAYRAKQCNQGLKVWKG